MNCKKLIALLMTPLLMLGGTAAAEPSEQTWTIGFSAREILPDMTRLENGEYYMAGYQSGYPAKGMLDPQYVRAIWLDAGDGKGGIVLAAIDCVALSSVDINLIRDRLTDFMAETGCRFVHVCATHTHAGIDTMGLWGPVGVSGQDADFMQTLYEQAETAVREAYANRKQGRLYYGTAEMPAYLFRDSREPEVVDPTLSCLRFAPSDGTRGLRVYHLSAHAEALRSANNLVSADFPGVLGSIVSEETGDDFAFFAGAVGGLIMTQQLNDNVYTSLKVTGSLLAEAALAIDNEEELAPQIIHETTEVILPLDNTLFLQMQFLGVLRSDAAKCESSTGMGVRSRMTYLQLGSLPIILTPGELFPELALGIPGDYEGDNPGAENPKSFAEILGTDRFLVFGLADDEIGYIVTPSDFHVHETNPYVERGTIANRRHYEETNSLGPQTANYIAETLEALVQTVESQDKESE